MALSALIDWEMRSSGDVDNGGGFAEGASGTDHSQQDSVFASRTDLVIGSAGSEDELSSSADDFASDDVGNVIKITAGSGFTVGWYEILSVAAGVATVDRNVGTADSTGGSGNLGGAMFPSDDFFEACVAGQTVHPKSGTLTLTASIAVLNDGTGTNPITIDGYNTSRGDNPMGTDRPLVAAGANAFTFDDFWIIKNIRMTGTANECIRADIGSLFVNVKANNSNAGANRSGINLGGQAASALNCEAEAALGRAINVNGGTHARIIGCYLHDSADGIVVSSSAGVVIAFCVLDTFTDNGIQSAAVDMTLVLSNTIYNASGSGIEETNGERWRIFNNIIDNCGVGIEWITTQMNSNYVDYNNFSNNTTDRTDVAVGDNDTALDPGFTDAVNGDFTVGTNMKATAFPGAFPGALVTGYLDQGAVQRQEPAGGGTTIINRSRRVM